MNKKELVNRVQVKVGGTKKTAEEYVDNTLEVILEALGNQEDIKLVGFGNWEIKDRAARKGRNPQTGEEIEIEAKRGLRFKPGKLMRNAVNGVVDE